MCIIQHIAYSLGCVLSAEVRNEKIDLCYYQYYKNTFCRRRKKKRVEIAVGLNNRYTAHKLSVGINKQIELFFSLSTILYLCKYNNLNA